MMMRSAAMNSLRQAVKSANNKLGLRSVATNAAVYTERQKAMGRPLSPHVTIYKWPISAISSITNRITGVALGVGFTCGSAIALVGGDIPSMIYACHDIVPFFGPLSKMVVAYPIVYHYFGGVRHLVWDVKPDLINLKQAPPTAWGLLVGAGVVSVLSAAITLKPKKRAKKSKKN